MEENLRKIKARMEKLCARREYCRADIMKKIVSALGEDMDQSCATEILGCLEKDGFVSDLRYASAFAREKSSISGWGEIKIRYALRCKRIENQVIEEALKEMDPGRAEAKLDKILSVKAASLKDDPQARLKLIRFALSRGYDYELVEKRLRSLRLV